MKNRPGLKILILIIVLLGSCSLYLAVLTPDRFGFYHDDGIYVVTAKALATDQGYHIISLPYEPYQTKFPPFYPFLLSLIWRLYPQFPENLSPMILLSVLATVAFLALSWGYLVKRDYAGEWQALLVVALAATNGLMVILATGLYSEMVYAALSAAVLWLAEANEKERRRWVSIALGAMIGLVFLTRISGITLLIAAVLYFISRRQFGKAFLLLAVGGSFVLAWNACVYVNGKTLQNVNAAYYTSYFRDFLENVSDFWTLLNVIGTNAVTLVLVFVPLVSLGLDYVQAQNTFDWNLIVIGVTFFFIATGFLRSIYATGFRLLHIYVVLYFLLHIFWPYTAFDRFLAPILPFLLLFLITELEFVLTLVRNNLTSPGKIGRKVIPACSALALVTFSSIAVYSHSSLAYRSLHLKAIYANRVSSDRQAIQWINTHTDPSDVLLCYRDPLYYLYTGRKATRQFLVKARISTQNEAAIYERAKIIFRIINESNARYLIVTSSDFEYEQQPDLKQKSFKKLVEQHPQTFVRVFDSGNGSAIYRINTS
jgi:hypothetical protein